MFKRIAFAFGLLSNCLSHRFSGWFATVNAVVTGQATGDAKAPVPRRAYVSGVAAYGIA
jgi:hypothetical protein